MKASGRLILSRLHLAFWQILVLTRHAKMARSLPEYSLPRKSSLTVAPGKVLVVGEAKRKGLGLRGTGRVWAPVRDRARLGGVLETKELLDIGGGKPAEPSGWDTYGFCTRRIGEAKNPGLGERNMRRTSEAGAPLQYPEPLCGGSRCIRTPGFSGGSWAGEVEKGEEDFKLQVETVNTTGWQALDRRIADSEANVILAQEHWCR